MDYRTLVAGLPRPSIKQTKAFASLVAHDHSWYKKLPMRGNGEPFFLYLHPAPHHVRVERPDGAWAWRSIVRVEAEPAWFPRWDIALEPGDCPPRAIMLGHYAEGKSTRDYLERYGHWAYWNWGSADQSRAEAIAYARRGLRVDDPAGDAAIPPEGLDRGLVYLRATVCGDMGPRTDAYEALRAEHGLPTVEDDAAAQRRAMVDAMEGFANWAYASASGQPPDRVAE